MMIEKPLARNTLYTRVKSFQLLWKYRDVVPDAIKFEPSLADINKLVKKYGHQDGSTHTIPIAAAGKLVAAAFQWVYEFGPALSELERSFAEPEVDSKRQRVMPKLESFNQIACAKGWNLALTSKSNLGLPSALLWYLATRTLLPAACFILCCTFTARRLSELLSMTTNSLSGSVETGFWLTSYIAKRDKVETTPCTRSVADSMQTLHRLLVIRGSQKELLFSVFRGRNMKRFAANALKSFAELVRATDESGNVWSFAPHQFRRLFALCYFWRYDDPSLAALSFHFQHMNLKQIRAYVNDAEMRRYHLEEGERFTLSKMRAIALGKVNAAGILGKTLKKRIEQLRQQLELTDEDGLTRALERNIHLRKLTLHPTPWGFCGAKESSSNLRRAACNKNADSSLKSNELVEPMESAEETCAGCIFHMTDDTRKPHWEAQINSLKRSIEACPKDGLVADALRGRLMIIERFTRNAFGQGAV